MNRLGKTSVNPITDIIYDVLYLGEITSTRMPDSGHLGFHIEDSRHLQRELSKRGAPSEPYVDAIITSPPYADLQEYGENDDQIGEQEYEAFLTDLKTVFEQCYEISTRESTLWINTDTFRRGGRIVRLPSDIADEIENLPELKYCEETGCDGQLHSNRGTGTYVCDKCGEHRNPLDQSWRLADHVIWDKKRTRPWYAEGKLRNVFEHVSMYSKETEFKYNVDEVRETDPEEFGRWWVDYPERYNPSGKVPNNLWSFPIPKQGQWGPKLAYHPSPFPPGLIARIIKLATDPGDTILDPFAGVGTTLAVANALDREAIGFELEEGYEEFYHEHVLPNAMPATSEQDTLRSHNNKNLESQIWTLRTHKYALELQRKMFTSEEFRFEREDLNSVFILADKHNFESKVPPSASLYFITQNGCELSDDDLSSIRDSLLDDTGLSGNYYEVDFTLEAELVGSFASRVTPSAQLADDWTDATHYIYDNATHYWYSDEITVSGWEREIKRGDWQRYLTDKAAPLVSTLDIRVDNPLDDDQSTSSDRQAVLGRYNEKE